MPANSQTAVGFSGHSPVCENPGTILSAVTVQLCSVRTASQVFSPPNLKSMLKAQGRVSREFIASNLYGPATLQRISYSQQVI